MRNPNSVACNVEEGGYKHNEIIYVGRLEYSQKRVDRILKVWKIVSRQNPDWRLTIIGDGNDRSRLENLSRKLKISSITFAGRQDPQPYYKEAKMLLLTSNHEGTPMVIQEAMSYGVVPVVMDSFSAASDMITDGYNGVLIKAFNIRGMAKAIKGLIQDPIKLQRLSVDAQTTINAIDNNRLLAKWDEVL